MDYSSFLQLHDEFSLLAIMVILLIYDVFAGEKSLKYFQPVAIVLLLAHTIFNAVPRDAFEVAGGMYQYVPMHSVIKTLLNIGTILIFLQANSWLNSDESRIRRGEFYFITLATLLGMYMMISAGHFLLFFIGIETASIPLATLVAFNKYNHKSAEAGAKFILTAVFSTGISLFGISLLYGSCGTLYFSDLHAAITGTPLQIMAMIFFSVGLFFKISLVPFHLWTADVYEGAPTSITAYLSVISKGAAVFALYSIFVKTFSSMIADWQAILYGMIVISITLANLFAIRQQNLKRLLAFSSISQAGYLVLGIIGGSATGLSSVVYYILVYMFSNIAAFGVISVIENKTGKVNISDYKGLYLTNPKLSIVLTLALFSLAGIPPFAGFFSKYFIFTSAFEQGFSTLVFIALANTVISLYYYLMVVKAIFFDKNEQPIETLSSDTSVKISFVVCSAAIILVGLVSSIYDSISVFRFGL